jgi:sulfatase modifying factor 1
MSTNSVRNLTGLLAAVCLGSDSAGQSPTINEIQIAAQCPQLTVESAVGVTNQIQFTEQLGKESAWTALTNLTVTASPYTVADPARITGASRFYRIMVMRAAPTTPTDMVLIPEGPFVMGDAFKEVGKELPLHTNQISAFYMDQNDVTIEKWSTVYQWAANNGYSFAGNAAAKASNHPVQSISWYDCARWCNARSEMEGRTPAYYTDSTHTNIFRSGNTALKNSGVVWRAGYRLPTEAEWEKAARGGVAGMRFPWGNTINETQANYFSGSRGADDLPYDLSDTGWNPIYRQGWVQPYTNPVGAFPANGYGLYDMAGNIAQWCWDRDTLYSSANQTDPQGGTIGSFRMVRGGSYTDNAQACQASSRTSARPDSGAQTIGFRTVLPQP